MILGDQSFVRPNYFFDLYENCVEKEIPFHICLGRVAIAAKPLFVILFSNYYIKK